MNFDGVYHTVVGGLFVVAAAIFAAGVLFGVWVF